MSRSAGIQNSGGDGSHPAEYPAGGSETDSQQVRLHVSVAVGASLDTGAPGRLLHTLSAR